MTQFGNSSNLKLFFSFLQEAAQNYRHSSQSLKILILYTSVRPSYRHSLVVDLLQSSAVESFHQSLNGRPSYRHSLVVDLLQSSAVESFHQSLNGKPNYHPSLVVGLLQSSAVESFHQSSNGKLNYHPSLVVD